MKIKPIPEWKQWWRMYSFWGFSVATAITEGWQFLPDDIKVMLDDQTRLKIAGVVIVATFILRFIKQTSLRDEVKDGD